jgi:hypothetical protein
VDSILEVVTTHVVSAKSGTTTLYLTAAGGWTKAREKAAEFATAARGNEALQKAHKPGRFTELT